MRDQILTAWQPGSHADLRKLEFSLLLVESGCVLCSPGRTSGKVRGPLCRPFRVIIWFPIHKPSSNSTVPVTWITEPPWTPGCFLLLTRPLTVLHTSLLIHPYHWKKTMLMYNIHSTQFNTELFIPDALLAENSLLGAKMIISSTHSLFHIWPAQLASI